MELCSGGHWPNGHEEIVFDEPHCPLCAAKKEIKRLELEIEKLRKENKDD